jgi:hypothetical protein
MMTSGVVLPHNIAPPHTAARTPAPLYHFNWELFDHPRYSPDCAPSGYDMFTYLKKWLASQRFNNNELLEGVQTWLSSEAADFFGIGIQKCIPRYDKCLNSGGHYVEKQLKYVRVLCM